MVFDVELARIYDQVYQQKDYGGEVDFIEDIFRRFAAKPVKAILDGGCGTGGHALPLARRGYQVTGIDVSRAMVKLAREKAAKADLSVTFQTRDLRHFDLKRKFDACLLMFAVLGYITETSDVLKTMENVSHHLKNGALFILDCWNGLAVMRVLPSVRTAIFENGGEKIIRTATPELDAFHHLCRVNYHLLRYRGKTILNEFKETHTVRYYFPQELIHLLEDVNFKVIKVCPFLDLNGMVDENTWNMAVIARKE